MTDQIIVEKNVVELYRVTVTRITRTEKFDLDTQYQHKETGAVVDYYAVKDADKALYQKIRVLTGGKSTADHSEQVYAQDFPSVDLKKLVTHLNS